MRPLAKHKVAGSTPVTRSRKVAHLRLAGLGNRLLCTGSVYRVVDADHLARAVLLLCICGLATQGRASLLLQRERIVLVVSRL